jgi:hypothetical protein
VNMSNLDDIQATPLLLDLSSEQKAALERLCSYHDKGLADPHVIIRMWHMVLMMACALAASAGLVVFANRIPPFYSTLLLGLILGALLTSVRYRLAFQRRWPLLEAIIDWKLAGRLRRQADVSDE